MQIIDESLILIALLFKYVFSQGAVKLYISESYRCQADYSNLQDSAVFGFDGFLLSSTEMTQEKTGGSSILTKNSTQYSFKSLDCSRTHCLIGSTNSEIYYYKFEHVSGSTFNLENLKTFKSSIPLTYNTQVQIIRMLDAFYTNGNIYFLAAMHGQWGVYKYAYSDDTEIEIFKPEDKNNKPVDMVYLTRTIYAAVAYNQNYLEIFDISNMAQRYKKFSGGGFLAYLDTGEGLTLSLYKNQNWNIAITEVPTGTVKNSFGLIGDFNGIFAYRSSEYFVVSTKSELHFYQYRELNNPLRIDVHTPFKKMELTVIGEMSLRNRLIKTDFTDNFSYSYLLSNGEYGTSTFEVSNISNHFNPLCANPPIYSFSAYCNSCVEPAKLKWVRMCFLKDYGKPGYEKLAIYYKPPSQSPIPTPSPEEPKSEEQVNVDQKKNETSNSATNNTNNTNSTTTVKKRRRKRE